MCTIVSGGEQLSNLLRLVFPVRQFFKLQSISCSLSLSMISSEHSQRFGFVISDATTSSHWALLLELSLLPAHTSQAKDDWDGENTGPEATCCPQGSWSHPPEWWLHDLRSGVPLALRGTGSQKSGPCLFLIAFRTPLKLGSPWKWGHFSDSPLRRRSRDEEGMPGPVSSMQK